VENSVFDALDRNGNFNATGYSLMIWGKYLGKQMVKTSSTLHLRTFASLDPEAGTLFVYLMNMRVEPQTAHLETEGCRIGSVLQAWELKGDGPQDCDPVWKEYRGMGNNGELLLDGTSITVVECQLEKTPARP
jgi:alpha-N-arabinofuranosidase